jgi:hypothetical protein
METTMKADTGAIQTITALASENTTVQELWEKSGKVFSNSHVYYIVRKYKLPFKRAEKTKPFKHLKALQAINTETWTIKHMMGLLDLSSRNDYHAILMTLKKNNLKFEKAKNTTWDFKLLELDTENMTIDQIAEEIGMQHAWQANKLYGLLAKLGKSYKSRK